MKINLGKLFNNKSIDANTFYLATLLINFGFSLKEINYGNNVITLTIGYNDLIYKVSNKPIRDDYKDFSHLANELDSPSSKGGITSSNKLTIHRVSDDEVCAKFILSTIVKTYNYFIKQL